MKGIKGMVKTLERTKKKQTTGMYHNNTDNSYCALGVLGFGSISNVYARIFAKYDVDVWETLVEKIGSTSLFLGDSYVDSIHDVIRIANDVYHLSFKQIAELLRCTFPDD